eukprot:8080502-Pyramimonas_sp.AAC.1
MRAASSIVSGLVYLVAVGVVATTNYRRGWTSSSAGLTSGQEEVTCPLPLWPATLLRNRPRTPRSRSCATTPSSSRWPYRTVRSW